MTSCMRFTYAAYCTVYMFEYTAAALKSNSYYVKLLFLYHVHVLFLLCTDCESSDFTLGHPPWYVLRMNFMRFFADLEAPRGLFIKRRWRYGFQYYTIYSKIFGIYRCQTFNEINTVLQVNKSLYILTVTNHFCKWSLPYKSVEFSQKCEKDYHFFGVLSVCSEYSKLSINFARSFSYFLMAQNNFICWSLKFLYEMRQKYMLNWVLMYS